MATPEAVEAVGMNLSTMKSSTIAGIAIPDAIALHTTPGIPEHKESEVALVTAGVELDVHRRPNFCEAILASPFAQ